ncbi:MAG TPA: nucleoside triphosphate pyrophosphatase [Gemmatimonadaceae bacterium]|nr:nucleoside triphosphate pyrophosphatase [Gemmatimonadaceae bacterium]
MPSPRVVLASSSPRRRELLSLIGIAHAVSPAELDERVLPGEAPEPHAARLAESKAAAVAERLGDDSDVVVIGADTIVVVDGDILGKPGDEATAAAMLRRLSGRSHTVFTAVAVAREQRLVSGVESVDVRFRVLSDADIARYIATGEPMDKAGAYGIQGYGATIVEGIVGDYFAVMGLALGRLVRLLKEVGVDYQFGELSDARGMRV